MIVVGFFILSRLNKKWMKMALEHFFMKMGSTCDTIIGPNSDIMK
jgi:hypothetical protein